MAFELSEDQLKTAENELKKYLPMSQQVCSVKSVICLFLQGAECTANNQLLN